MAEETNKPGRPAFEPTVFPVVSKLGEATLIEGGMTKREVAALSIMAAIISNPGTRTVNFHVLDSGVIAPFLAKEAIALADALIAELDKGKDKENCQVTVATKPPPAHVEGEDAPGLLAACKLAERWLANCVPVAKMDGPTPLPVLRAAIADAMIAENQTRESGK